MAARKKRRRRKGPGVTWRAVFGLHGPTKQALKAELKKGVARYFAPQTITSVAHDPVTQKRVTKVLSVDPKTGVISEVRRGRKGAGKTAASKASQPSRTSRAGQTSRRIVAAPSPVQQVPRQPRAKSMSERTEERRRPDGTFDGSAPAVDPAVRVAREYQRIMQDVARLNRRTDRDLGWDREL